MNQANSKLKIANLFMPMSYLIGTEAIGNTNEYNLPGGYQKTYLEATRRVLRVSQK